MKHIRILATLTLFSAIFSQACAGRAQSVPTANRQLDLSVFAAGTGTFTRIAGGKNLSFTAGADLTYLPLRLLRPSLEIRGTYPVDTGHIDSQKSFLVGPKVEHPFGRLAASTRMSTFSLAEARSTITITSLPPAPLNF
jgi:hypothetical protein